MNSPETKTPVSAAPAGRLYDTSAVLVFFISLPFALAGVYACVTTLANADRDKAMIFAGIAGGVGMLWAIALAARSLWRGERRWLCWTVILFSLVVLNLPVFIAWRILYLQFGGVMNVFIRGIMYSGVGLFGPLSILILGTIATLSAPVFSRTRRRRLIFRIGAVALALLVVLPAAVFMYAAVMGASLPNNKEREQHPLPAWICSHTPNYIADAMVRTLRHSDRQIWSMTKNFAVASGCGSRDLLIELAKDNDAFAISAWAKADFAEFAAYAEGVAYSPGPSDFTRNSINGAAYEHANYLGAEYAGAAEPASIAKLLADGGATVNISFLAGMLNSIAWEKRRVCERELMALAIRMPDDVESTQGILCRAASYAVIRIGSNAEIESIMGVLLRNKSPIVRYCCADLISRIPAFPLRVKVAKAALADADARLSVLRFPLLHNYEQAPESCLREWIAAMLDVLRDANPAIQRAAAWQILQIWDQYPEHIAEADVHMMLRDPSTPDVVPAWVPPPLTTTEQTELDEIRARAEKFLAEPSR